MPDFKEINKSEVRFHFNLVPDIQKCSEGYSVTARPGSINVLLPLFSKKLKTRLFYEYRGERKLIMLMTILLFSLRTNFVWLNQNQTVFMPNLSVEAWCFIRDCFHF